MVPLTLQARGGLINFASFHAFFWCSSSASPQSEFKKKFATMGSAFRSVTSRETGLTTKFLLETGGHDDIMAMPEYSRVHGIVELFARKS